MAQPPLSSPTSLSALGRRSGIALALLAACGMTLGCAGAALKTRTTAVGETIAAARKNGAQTCAPVQLAMAESHHAFAQTEYDEGDYFRAKEELAVAEKNANEALSMSPMGRCVNAPRRVQPPADEDSDGDGVPNSTDDCPRRPEDLDDYKDADGCPDLDNDQDGIVDTIDDCPNNAEDKDGFKDDDGCPDVDNDEDGLSDRIDQCPDKAEDDDGFEDDDGCPDCDNDGDGVLECPKKVDMCPDQPAATADGCPAKYKNVVVTAKKIEIRQTVYFDTNKTTIKPVSFGLLNEVAMALKDNPKISIQVEGHTDSRGRNARNLRLSQGRANSVRTYLIGQGVGADRMAAKGFGEEIPLSDNRTNAGREQNRRVEFLITGR
ncbi:MAG: OmpA family protein [Myxococcales bacterium]|nr:OmpA family protein [Myxococcales bacterium]